MILDLLLGDECTVGHYCPSGSSLPKPCEPGYYMNHSQSTECDPCPTRYFCTNQVKPMPCPQGKWFTVQALAHRKSLTRAETLICSIN